MTTPAGSPAPAAPAAPTTPTAPTGAPTPPGAAPAGPPAPSSSPTTGPAGQGAEPAAAPAEGTGTPDAAGAGGDQASAESDAGKVSSGEDAGSATNRFGQGTSLHEYLTASQHLVDGDLVGGDKFVFLTGGDNRVPLRRLSPTLTDTVRHAFVDPQSWDELRERFNRQRTVLLRGLPGTGRHAMAIRLLQSAQAQEVYDLDPTVDLTRLADTLGSAPAKTPQASTGYLLSQPRDLSQLRAWTLQSLEDALARSDARLVLTISMDTHLADDDLVRYTIDLPAAPDGREILARHLRWRVGDDLAETRLAQPDVQAYIDELLVAAVSCERSAYLAEMISLETGETVDIDRVRRLVDRRSDRFDIWFDSLTDLDVRSFAIALAVLDGLPYEDVAAAARELYQRLDTARQVEFTHAPVLRPRDSNPFRMNLRRRLDILHATAKPETMRLSLGSVWVTAVRYRDSTYAKRVLERVWRDYQIHDVLLDWLAQLVGTRSEYVYIFAGTALGVFSTLSFDYVRRSVLDPWAAGTDRQRREAVALALRVAADDKQLQPVVTTMVGGWYNDRAKPARQATAARAHGLSLGLTAGRRDAIAAVDTLDRLAMVDRMWVAIAIGDSLAGLIYHDPELVTPKVYDTLLRWLDDRRRSPAGHLAFLLPASLLVTDVPADSGPPTSWPTLLLLAKDHPASRSSLFALWHRVLDDGMMHAEAEGVLTYWASLAESDPALLDAFARMLRAVAALSVRTHQTLSRLADEWVDDDRLQPLLQVSAAVSTALGSTPLASAAAGSSARDVSRP